MAQGRIEIEFKPKGDKALILAVKQLDVVTKRLKNTTSVYEKELKKLEVGQKKVRGGMLDITNQGRLLGGSFATLRSKILLASFAAGIFAKTLGKLGSMYGFQEAAENRLSTAMGKNVDVLKAYAAQVQKNTAFGDEEVINAMALIANYTTSEKVVKQLTDSTLNLAAAKGKSLSEAAEMVAKTVFSSTNALQREGVTVEGLSGSVQRLNSLQAGLSALYAGQATAATRTYNGAIKDLEDSLGDLGENLGEVLVPALKVTARIIQTLAEYFDVQRIKNYGLAIVSLGSSYLVLTGTIKAAAIASLNFLKANKMVMLAILAITAVAEVADRVFNVFGTDVEDLENEINDLSTTILEMNNKFDVTTTAMTSVNIRFAHAISLTQLYVTENKKLGSIQERRNILEAKQVKMQDLINDGLIEGLELGTMQNQLEAEGNQIDIDATQIKIQNSIAMANAIMGVADAYNRAQQASLDAQKASALAATKGIRSERRRAKAVEKIEKEFAAKQDALNKKSKRMKRAQTVINTSAAIMEAYASKELDPIAKHIMAVFVGLQGAMQLATIDATKYAQGGYVGGRRHSQGGTMIEAERGEYVVSRRGVDAIGLEALNRINAGAGGGSVNISFSGNILSKDFLEDEAIPQIKEALRRGGDIGVG